MASVADVELESKVKTSSPIFQKHQHQSIQKHDATMAPKKPKKEKWEKSRSKALLRSGFLLHEYNAETNPKYVYNSDPEHKKWKYSNWVKNFDTLMRAIDRDRTRMQNDVIAYGHDLALVKEERANNQNLPWHLSDAFRLLKQDVKDGLHEAMKPAELYATRQEYSDFPLDVFRKHIYQEVDSIPKREIRFQRKKKHLVYPELFANQLLLAEHAEDSGEDGTDAPEDSSSGDESSVDSSNSI